MHNEPREEPNAERGFEQSDLNLDAIRKGSIGFFSFLIVMLILGAITFYLMYWKNDPLAGKTDANRVERIVPEGAPLLQTNVTVKTDIKNLRRRESELLSTTGPSPENPGKQRIPIQAAIEVLAERGLPSTKETAAKPTHHLEGLKPEGVR